ncbi:tyrosine-type recombinase/integrase [Bacteriovoracaceae bacterium]|nr:tyrosine-type recombinase/integrase [Bacteriovoracaceae bacterium]
MELNKKKHLSLKEIYSDKKNDIESFLNEFLFQFISEETKRAYLSDLNNFFLFLRNNQETVNEPGQLRSYHFQAYRDHLINCDLSSASINRKLVALRSFIKWSMALKYIDHNPFDAVKLPKVQTENETIAFSDEEVSLILNKPKSDYKGEAHRTILYLLFHLGLRRSELSKIKIRDIYQDHQHLILKIQGKGKKIREIPLPIIVQNQIKKYLNLIGQRERTLSESDYLIQLFKNKINPNPIDGSSIFRIINKYAKECGIQKRISPHSARATVISHLLDTQKIPMRDVATFAGHSKITTTERYDKRRNNMSNSPSYKVNYKDKKLA